MDNPSLQRPAILAVDDEPTNLRFLQEILKDEYQIYLAPSGERALIFLQSNIPDLILLDIEMPKMNGYQVIEAVKRNPAWKDIPIIFLTAQEGRDKEQTAFELGAVDYILKPISIGIVKARTRLHVELESYRKKLEDIVETRTTQLKHTQDAILNMLANMTSYRDNETGMHIKRTTTYSQIMVHSLMRTAHPSYEMDPQYARSIVKSAKLHDIGKVAVPDNILLKPGKLTPEEFELIKLHSVYGAEILDNAIDDLGNSSSFLYVAREIIIAHHEKWDGSGYPYQLSGSSIPLSARIMAVADVYDALISKRPYKTAFSHEKAVSIILEETGTHFDPILIELLLPDIQHFREVALLHQD